MTSSSASARLTSPEQWCSTFTVAPPPLIDLDGGMMCEWSGTSPVMIQPPLDHHYLAFHRGGAKRVKRFGDGATRHCDVTLNSFTAIPAGTGFSWHTEGPISFAHLYIHPHRLERVLSETFERDPRGVTLEPSIGQEDRLIVALLDAMIDPALDNLPDGRLARETWYEALLVRVLHSGPATQAAASKTPGALAPHILRRVQSYLEENLSKPIALDDLAELAGLSRFHFCRAFHTATGLPPHAWMTRARLDLSRRLLRETDLPIGQIATRCGYAGLAQFSTRFKGTSARLPASGALVSDTSGTGNLGKSSLAT